jgi:hypothetical protein
MRPDGRVLFAGAIALLAAWALLQTVGWPIKTALYARAVGIPLLILAIAETLLCLRGEEETEAREAIDVALSASVPPDVAARRTTVIVAWMVGFYVAVILIGFPRAVPLFVLAYLRGQAKESWILSLLLPALAWLGFYLLFVRLLHLPFADGLLWEVLFR